MSEVVAAKAMFALADLQASGDVLAAGSYVLVDMRAETQSIAAAALGAGALVNLSIAVDSRMTGVFALVDLGRSRVSQAGFLFALADIQEGVIDASSLTVLVDMVAPALRIAGSVFGLVDFRGAEVVRVGQQMLLLDARLSSESNSTHAGQASALVDVRVADISTVFGGVFVLADLCQDVEVQAADVFVLVDAVGVPLGMKYRLRGGKALVDGQAWPLGSM